jgi:hypothetical protein
MLVCTLAAAVLGVTAGCGGGGAAPGSAATDSPAATGPATGATTDAATEPLQLTTELIRSRRDEANERLRVRLTNHGEQPVEVDEIRLIAPPYSPGPAKLSGGRQLNPGLTIAYQVVHGEPECVGDDPAPGTVEVEVRAGDRRATLDPGESVDLIRRMLTLACARQRVLEVVDVRLDTEWDLADNGNEQTGNLLIERRAGGPPITLTGVRGGINYTLELVEPESKPTLDTGERVLTVPVHSLGARCDGHAMGDNSKPYAFSVWISLDGGSDTHLEFNAEDQADNFVRLCSSG